MIGLFDMADAVRDALCGAGYRLLADAPRQAQIDEYGALLYVQVLPLSEATGGAGRLTQRAISCDIALIDGDAVSNRSFYTFVREMDAALRPVLPVADRRLLLQDIQSNLIDGVGHYSFTLRFWDDLDHTTNPECPAGFAEMDTLVLGKEVR